MKLIPLDQTLAQIEGVFTAYGAEPFIVSYCGNRHDWAERNRDEIIRRVNAYDRLTVTLDVTTKTIEAMRPVLNLDCTEEGAELARLLDVLIGEAKAALALAAASETRTEAASDAKTGTQGGE